MTTSSCLRALGIALIALSCAGAPKGRDASSPRFKDSAPEKIASQRAGAPQSLKLEQEDERWGFEAARERRRDAQDKKARKDQAASDKAVGVTGPGAR